MRKQFQTKPPPMHKFITYERYAQVFARVVIATQHRIVCICLMLRFAYSNLALYKYLP
jgi:hypothetical protein